MATKTKIITTNSWNGTFPIKTIRNLFSSLYGGSGTAALFCFKLVGILGLYVIANGLFVGAVYAGQCSNNASVYCTDDSACFNESMCPNVGSCSPYPCPDDPPSGLPIMSEEDRIAHDGNPNTILAGERCESTSSSCGVGLPECNWSTQGTCLFPANGSCKSYNAAYLSQPASSTANGCNAGTYSDLSNSGTQRQWRCSGVDGGNDVTCGAAIASCDGAPPALNSIACNDGGDPTSSNQPGTVEGSCSVSKACDWICAAGFIKDGESCVPETVPGCGNGVIDVGEDCDDENNNNFDRCTNACKDNVCSDGIVNVFTEQCDGGGGCDTSCNFTIPTCGLTPSKTLVEPFETITFSLSYDAVDSSIGELNLGDGLQMNASPAIQYSYTTPGTYLVHFSVSNKQESLIQVTCSETITVSYPTCGDGNIDAGEQCGESGLSCSGGAVCNVTTCRCDSMCEIDTSDPIDFYVSPLDFGDGFDAEAAPDVDHAYNYTGTYTAEFSVVNPGNSVNKVSCDQTIQVNPRLCGNGAINPGEECGEAGLLCAEGEICNPYSCTCSNECEQDTLVIDEECDDGNGESGDGCSQVCQLEFCGDGEVDSDGENNIAGDGDDEACDDGNNINDDGCTNRCQFPGCGDSYTISPEDCDGGSYCDDGTNCTLNPYLCYNGLIECKPRNTVSCSAQCVDNDYCGDGERQTPNTIGQNEQCDDGNSIPTDECHECENTICGDGQINYVNSNGEKEQCDNGVLNGTAGNTCTIDCKDVTLYPVGQCHPYPYVESSDLSTFGASAGTIDLCLHGQAIPHPDGDGSVPYWAAARNAWIWMCDGAEANSEIECSTWTCGDGIVDQGQEECDDGNDVAGDGCDESCELEPIIVPFPEYAGACVDQQLPTVQDDEFLPARWLADYPEQIVVEGAVDCAELESMGPNGTNGIPERMLDCEFSMYREGTKTPYSEQLRGDCLNGIDHTNASRPVNTSQGRLVMEDALNDFGFDSPAKREQIMGVGFVSDTDVYNMSRKTAGGSAPQYGQYKSVLERATYTYCARTRDASIPYTAIGGASGVVSQVPVFKGNPGTYEVAGGICDLNFSIVAPYFLQKGVAVSESKNRAPSSLVNFDGVSLVTQNTPLDDALNKTTAYVGAGRTYLLNDFIDTFRSKFVVEYDKMIYGKARTFMKVPNQRIFYFKPPVGLANIPDYDGGNSSHAAGSNDYNLVLEENELEKIVGDINDPFTLIVEGANVIFKGSVLGKGLFAVEKDIVYDAFESGDNCDDTDVIQGIFITNGTFRTNLVRNNNLNHLGRCNGGNMRIEGILIGTRAGNFQERRRSVLNAWEPSSYLFETVPSGSGSTNGGATTAGSTAGGDGAGQGGVTWPLNTELYCNNMIDDDADGSIDCDDTDCLGATECQQTGTNGDLLYEHQQALGMFEHCYRPALEYNYALHKASLGSNYVHSFRYADGSGMKDISGQPMMDDGYGNPLGFSYGPGVTTADCNGEATVTVLDGGSNVIKCQIVPEMCPIGTHPDATHATRLFTDNANTDPIDDKCLPATEPIWNQLCPSDDYTQIVPWPSLDPNSVIRGSQHSTLSLDPIITMFMSFDSTTVTNYLNNPFNVAGNPKYKIKFTEIGTYPTNFDFGLFTLGQNLPVDTDGDGLLDSDEIASGTSETNPDTDGDKVCDGDITVFDNANALICVGGPDVKPLDQNSDTDGDGLLDFDEMSNSVGSTIVTSPVMTDTDNDGLSDHWEMNSVLGPAIVTDPTNPDSDGDTYSDFDEYVNDSDPLDPLDRGQDASTNTTTTTGPVEEDKAIVRSRTQNLIDGASLVVEINPEIWSFNPPGAEEFLKELQVFK